MFSSAHRRFAVTLIVSVLGFVLTLDEPVGTRVNAPLTMQVPQR